MAVLLWGPDTRSRRRWGWTWSLRATLPPSPWSPPARLVPRGLRKAWALTVATGVLQPSTGRVCVLLLVLDLAGNVWLVGVTPECGRRDLREVPGPQVSDKHRRRQGPALSLSPCTSPHAAARPVGGQTLALGEERLRAGTLLGEKGNKGPGKKLSRRFREAGREEESVGRRGERGETG